MEHLYQNLWQLLYLPVAFLQYGEPLRICRQLYKQVDLSFSPLSLPAYLLNQMDKEERTTLLKDLYTKEGANLSIGRLTIGSCDYSAELYSYDDVPFDTELKHFSIERDEKYIIPMIKEILAIKPDLYLFASPWSPPGWPNIGPNPCGGFVTRHSVTGELNFSGQYKAIKNIAKYISPKSKIYALNTSEVPKNRMNLYPKSVPTVEGFMIDNGDEHPVYVIVNPADVKKQVQFYTKDSWWYAELMPDTVSTIVF